MLIKIWNNWNSQDTAGRTIKWLNYFEKQYEFFFKSYTLPYTQRYSLKGIYQREIKAYVHTKTYTHIFTVALFLIAQNWNQPRCPPIIEDKQNVV